MTESNRRLRALVLFAVALPAAGSAVPAPAAPLTHVSRGAAPADGASSRPALSPDGTLVAFDSTAANLAPDANGAVQDVFLRDLRSGATQIVSLAPGGAAADGASSAPVLADPRGTVVFTSAATNLVEGDTNGARDVFVRTGDGRVQRVSVGAGGSQGDGASYEPDVSRDGRRVVFTSGASNLVPGDTNGVEDVFVRDLATGVTRRVSESAGRSFQGRSRAPSISPDGRWATFESAAADVVAGDRNEVADVFRADLDLGTIGLVSVSSSERQQNRAVASAFTIVSDVSAGGRFVVWDSDATNLVRGDRNDDTDVFVRDMNRGTTSRISVSATGEAADNDAYFPRISDDGRFVGFSSFARNLWAFDRGDEDLFVHDRSRRATTLLTADEKGGRRGPERRRQLLRRPAFSGNGLRVAFTSTAPLSASDSNGLEDVYTREAASVSTRIVEGPAGVVRTRRPRYRLASDAPDARFVCRIDSRRPYFCERTGRLPALARGTHRFTVRAAAAGMLFDPSPVLRRFRVK
jgi:Tol biopolymer transport system component